MGCIHCMFAELLKRRPKTADKTCLFVSPKGKAASKDWLAKCVRKVMDRAGIPTKFKAHSIRHAASSAMVRTEGLAETLRIFGWAGPQMLLKHYLGVVAPAQAEDSGPSRRERAPSPEGED